MHWSRWIAAAALAVGVSLAVATGLTQYSHNEEMYVSAGVLVSQGAIPYRDFAYLQAPYLIWLYGALYSVVAGPGAYLLTAKLVSLAAYAATLLLVFRIARTATESTPAAWLITGLCSMNLLVTFSTAEASNYAAPLAAAVGALRVYQQAPARWWGCGLLLAIAVGVKLTFAPLVFPFLVAALRDSPRAAGRFIGGLTLGLVPFGAHLVAGLDVVLFNNVGFHQMQAAWRLAHTDGPALTLLPKLKLAGILFLQQPPNWWSAAAAVVAVMWSRQVPAARGAMVCLGLLASGLFSAFYATPSYPQYFAMPAVWGLLVVAFLWRATLRRAPERGLAVLAALVLGAALNTLPLAFRALVAQPDSQPWVSARLHEAGAPLRAAIDARPDLRGRPVATVSPIMSLEHGLPIYRELATGSFAYEYGDELTEAERRRYVVTSPSSIAALLDAQPPAAIVVGLGGDLDTPLRAYAESRGYTGPFPASFFLEFYLAR